MSAHRLLPALVLLLGCADDADPGTQLDDLGCAEADLPVLGADGWACLPSSDLAPTLDEAAVQAIVDQAIEDLPDPVLAPIATSGSWDDLEGIPAALADGDADTLAGLGCSDGTYAVRQGAAWSCAPRPEAAPATWPIARGGTGATTAADARAALGAAPVDHDHPLPALGGQLADAQLGGTYTGELAFTDVTALTADGVSASALDVTVLTAADLTVQDGAVSFDGTTITGGSFEAEALSGDGSGLTGVGTAGTVVLDRGCATATDGTVRCRANAQDALSVCATGGQGCATTSACTFLCVQDSAATVDVARFAVPQDGWMDLALTAPAITCRADRDVTVRVDLLVDDIDDPGPAAWLASQDVVWPARALPTWVRAADGLRGLVPVVQGHRQLVLIRLTPMAAGSTCFVGGAIRDGAGFAPTITATILPTASGL